MKINAILLITPKKTYDFIRGKESDGEISCYL